MTWDVRSRRVAVVEGEPLRAAKPGGRPLLWAFGVQALAKLFNRKPATIRKQIRTRALDPQNLAMIAHIWAEQNGFIPRPPPESKRPRRKVPTSDT